MAADTKKCSTKDRAAATALLSQVDKSLAKDLERLQREGCGTC
jgi:hypothetical protein